MIAGNGDAVEVVNEKDSDEKKRSLTNQIGGCTPCPRCVQRGEQLNIEFICD